MSYGMAKLRCNDCKASWFVTWGMVGMQSMASGATEFCPDCKSSDISNVCDGSTPAQWGQIAAPRLQIKYRRLTTTAKVPTKAYDGDLGWDLYADANFFMHNNRRFPTDIPWIVHPHTTTLVPTGLAIELPAGWGGLIRPRSSQGMNSIHVFGGVMDNGYRGPWGVLIHNADHKVNVNIKAGEKIGQLVLIPLPDTEMIEAELSDTSRGVKGYGSSDAKI